MTQRIAIYDLDRTITSLPTWTPFLLEAAWRHAPWRLAIVPLLAPVALLRAVRLVSRDRLKETMHRLLLGPSIAPHALDRIAARFAARFVARHIHPGAWRQMQADRAAGWRIVIATAAHRFYARPIAERLGIDDLIATEASGDADGRLSWRIAGANCYGAAKRGAIAAWLADQGLTRAKATLRFYSDHHSDVPTFAWVDEPIVVNPNRSFAAVARQRGWAVADWSR